MIVPTFKDRSVRERFAREGYAVFPGFGKDLVDRLRSVYREMIDAMPPSDPYFEIAMTGTNCIGNLDLRGRVLAAVAEIIAPELETILEEYRLVGAGFRVKQARPDSELPLHQDPTQNDDERAWLINIIMPIVDTTPENGALRIVPGSHRIMPRLRSLDLEDRAETLNLDEVIAPLAETIPMTAGDAIFYYQSLLHGSGPNLGAEDRPLVLGTLMARKEPVTVYFRQAAGSKVFESYEVPDDYFNRMKDFDREHKLRPQVGRRLDDVTDTYDMSREDLVAAFRELSTARD